MPTGTNGGMRKRFPVILLTVLGITLYGCGGHSTKGWIEQLRPKNSAERLRAVKALGKKSREAEVVTPAIAVALKDEDAFVRRDAAEALGELGAGAKSAFSALLEAAGDKNADVRRQAAKALKRIDPEAAARSRNAVAAEVAERVEHSPTRRGGHRWNAQNFRAKANSTVLSARMINTGALVAPFDIRFDFKCWVGLRRGAKGRPVVPIQEVSQP